MCESSISKATLHAIEGEHLSCSEVSPTITITKLCLYVFPATAARPYDLLAAWTQSLIKPQFPLPQLQLFNTTGGTTGAANGLTESLRLFQKGVSSTAGNRLVSPLNCKSQRCISGSQGYGRAIDETAKLESYLRERHHECKHSTHNKTTDQLLLVADRCATNTHITLVHYLQPVRRILQCNEPITSWYAPELLPHQTCSTFKNACGFD